MGTRRDAGTLPVVAAVSGGCWGRGWGRLEGNAGGLLGSP